MTRSLRTPHLFFAFTLGALVSTSRPADAQSSAVGDGFALQQFEPAPAGDRFFGVSDAGVGPERGFARLLGNYAFRPLVTPDGAGGDRALVRHQLYAHLGGAVAVADRALLHFDLPLQLASSGPDPAVGSGGGVGDLRLGLRVRLAGRREGPFSLALGGNVWVASGAPGRLAGDGENRGEPQLLASGQAGPFVYAFKGGVLLRKHRDFGRPEIGPALTFGAAAGVLLADGRLQIGPELYGNTVFAQAGSRSRFLATSSSPVELLAGLRYRAGDLTLGGAVGPGLTRAPGTPSVRTLLSLAYEPAPAPAPPRPADRDGDGVPDARDACPDVAAPVGGGDPARAGCPAERVGDGDGDGDGVPDARDACPGVAGAPSADATKSGCPAERDGDGDGVPDARDACPGERGEADPDPSKSGCPQRVRVTEREIVIAQKVQFTFGKAELDAASATLLDEVAAALTRHPEIVRLEIQGHTDDRGPRARNLQLSGQRAEAVRAALIKRGVEPARLEAKGYGPDAPVADNATDEGRESNRRVQFTIVEKK